MKSASLNITDKADTSREKKMSSATNLSTNTRVLKMDLAVALEIPNLLTEVIMARPLTSSTSNQPMCVHSKHPTL